MVEAAGGEIIYVKADADVGGDGTSWEDAFTDLQDALAEADEGDEIGCGWDVLSDKRFF